MTEDQMREMFPAASYDFQQAGFIADDTARSQIIRQFLGGGIG